MTEPTVSAPEDAGAPEDAELRSADGHSAHSANSAHSAPDAATAARRSRSDAALDRYQHALRRRRGVYFAVLAVLVAVVGTVVGVAWARGEISHVSLHTFRPPPSNLPVAAPSAKLQEAWRTSDRVADGVPRWRGTVITYSAHTVGGRDARTGKRTWTYTRTDRTICTVAQTSGTTIAVFENRGNCDELDAFYSSTGGRRWTRTLDFDGMPVSRRPVFQTTPSTYLVTMPTAIYAIDLDPRTGFNRWTYQRNGCRIRGAVLGSTGALISQVCSSQVNCGSQKFCRPGPQLLLRDGSTNRDDNSKDNPDKIKWADFGNRTIPVSADGVTSAVANDGTQLHLFDPSNGKQTRRLELNPSTSALTPFSATATTGGELIWLSGRAYAIRPGAAKADWSVGTSAPPVIVSPIGDSTPTLASARITVASTNGIRMLDGTDGHTVREFPVAPPRPGSRVDPLGTGFLVSGPSGAVAYR